MSNIGYTGSIIAFNGYYIHYHQENIGKANNGSVPNIVEIFHNHRKGVLDASKNAYRKMFESNVISTSSMALLGEVFSDDKTFSELDKQMTEQVQAMINTQKLEKLMKIQKETIDKKDFSKLLSKKNSDKFAALDKLLTQLYKCCKILNSNNGGQLAAILATTIREEKKTKKSLVNLHQALNNFIENNNGETIDEQRAVAAAEAINALALNLIDGKTRSGETLTASSVKNTVDYIFNTGFAEGVASILNDTVDKSIKKAVKTSLTGQNQVSGVTITMTGMEEVTDSTLRSGKVDIKFSNLQFNIQQTNSLSGGTIFINAGISNKFYRTNHFPNLDKRKSKYANEYSSGSGGTFKEAIDTIFGNNIYNKYLAYNIMAHRSKRTKETQMLQDLILTRQLVKLFSSRGGEDDFSQWMLVNGQVISIWQLIMSTGKFVGLSHSQIHQTNNQTQLVSLSLPNTVNIEKQTTIIDPYVRVPLVNKLLNEMTIKAYVHLDNIKRMQALSKNP